MDDLTQVLPKRKPNLDSQCMGTETVVHDEALGKVHVLNATAAFIWERCDGQTQVGELVEEMSAAFRDVARENLREDIQRTLVDLEGDNLVLPQ